MRLHTYVMLRCCTFSCTCTHTSCYAAVRSHALAHIRHATLLYVLMHSHTYVMLRSCTFSCTCTHTSCYAAVRSHCTHMSCYTAVRSHALAHIRHATLLYVLMHLHTYIMLRCCTFSLHTYVMLHCCTFSCTCTHTSCYAAVRSHALAHIRHAHRMINIQLMMMMMMMKLLLMLKFRFSAFCGPPCKMFEKWQQRGPPRMPGTMFLFTRIVHWKSRHCCFQQTFVRTSLRQHDFLRAYYTSIQSPTIHCRATIVRKRGQGHIEKVGLGGVAYSYIYIYIIYILYIYIDVNK